MPRLNAKTAKAFRRAARKHAPNMTSNYVENTTQRKTHTLPFLDKEGNPLTYTRGGPIRIETNCFRGAYRSYKKIYKKMDQNSDQMKKFKDDL